MIGGIILAVIAVLCLIACIGYFVSSQKEVRNRIDKRRSYVESLGPKARVIVNNGTHLFIYQKEAGRHTGKPWRNSDT